MAGGSNFNNSRMSDSSVLNRGSLYQNIQKGLTTGGEQQADNLLDSVEVLQSVDSTNSYLLNQAIFAGKAKLCIAEEQTSGRGRRGNDWQSASHENIMLSLSWGFELWPDTITALGLAVGLIVAERLNQDYGLGVEIKWPNDLLIDGEKLAGILIDVAGDASGACNVVVGLGLNVNQPNWSESDAIYAWTDLRSHDVGVDRNDLVGVVISDLILMLCDFAEHGFAPLVERWNALSLYNGAEIMLIQQDNRTTSGEAIMGRMIGIDQNGALVVATPSDGKKVITSSQYSLRPYDPNE